MIIEMPRIRMPHMKIPHVKLPRRVRPASVRPPFLEFPLAVDTSRDNKLVKIIGREDDGKPIFGDPLTIAELPEDAGHIRHGEWIGAALGHNKKITAFFVGAYSIPAIAVFWIVFLLLWPKPMIISPLACVVLILTYKTLSKVLIKPAFYFGKTESNRAVGWEAYLWRRDYQKFPPEAMIPNDSGEPFLFIDLRFNDVRILPVWKSKQDYSESKVTSGSILGIESYNNSAYQFARQKSRVNALQKSLPFLIILGGSFLAIYLGAQKLARLFGE